MPNFKRNWRDLISEIKNENDDYDDKTYGINVNSASSVLYNLDELKFHNNKEKAYQQQKQVKPEYGDDLLYDEDGNILPYRIYQKLLKKKKQDDQIKALQRTKAFFMSSVSKDDQDRQLIKKMKETPSVGRYKPKYEFVDK